jgi:NADPH:quinone reductase-like Zn-dependent oxidoreductase
MKAVVIPKYGRSTVLEVREFPDPTPGPSEVRIQVKAAGLNFAEITARQGLYPDAPKPPCVVGYEVAGVVDLVGSEVNGLSEGDRVVGFTRFGGHASLAVLDQSLALRMPEGMSFEQGAAIPVNYLTAHHVLFHIGHTHPGSRILLHMAAGGVGTAVLQLLQTVPEVQVFGTASASKHDYLRNLGCAHPIDYRSQDYVEVIREVLGVRAGLDLVLDPLGGPHWKKGWSLLAPTGRLVAYGLASAVEGPKRSLLRVARAFHAALLVTPFSLMNDNRSLQGVNFGHLWTETERLRPQFLRVMSLFEEGIVRPHIHRVFDFEDAAAAHRELEEGRNRGKVLLRPG